ncbi:hypothetical protein J2I47_05505 [Fibrella sp. HMF5335]|uniref:Uncharacterized protein n=1 Tax=Fibrella rubiginis TaxID=2817060 RepID=A0A939K4B5_9BACT|nr:hypothetical protein [Fibrella rubiginis]MBO0935996.1 hypothetical protein [Fibrella rubiginis]
MLPILLDANTFVQKDFFTVASVTTFAGATGITYVIANGLQKAFDFNPKWLALAIGIIVCELGAALSSASGVADYLMAVVNGFLVFNTAGGMTSLTGPPAPPAGGTTRETPFGPTRREFTSPWF